MSEAPRADMVAPPRQSRPRDTFEEFYAWELPRLVALARGLASAGIAEDLAQEAMLATYRRWSHVRELERPELWVRRTCANLAVSQFRRRLVEIRATALLSARRPPPEEVSATTQEFWSAVRRLPRRQAQAAALRFVYDMPIADMATTLGCSEGTVKQHLSRARRALAAALNANEEAAS